MSATADGSPPLAETGRGPALVLALLLVVYIFNFVDRQIVGILAAPIKAELRLGDAQLGLLGGLSFALLYSTLGIPLGWLADRTGRVRVIAVSLGLWSICTALCGLAGGFTALFLARVGVGIGEAGGTAPAYALIGESVPPERRARALAIYALGIPLGSALGVLLGGYVAARVDWRAAFLAVGLAGLGCAPLFALAMRGRSPARRAEPTSAPGPTLRQLAASRAFWLLAFGAAAASIPGYGFAFWLPSLLQRSFGLDLIATARLYGALLLVGGSAGVLASGWLADRLGRRDRAAFAVVPALAFLISIPLFAAGFLSGSAPMAFVWLLVPQGLSYMWLAPVLTATQQLVPAPLRATAAACLLLVVNLIGVGLGTPAIGALADALAPRLGDEALRWAMTGALGMYAVAAALLALAARALRTEWME